jgi:hypothetical protein
MILSAVSEAVVRQMVEWAQREDDPDSYEIPKLDQDLPECLKSRVSEVPIRTNDQRS